MLAIATSFQFAFAQYSSQDSANIRKSYLADHSYSPSPEEIQARFLCHNGFGGMQLDLQTDRNFIITNYSDIVDTLAPDPRLAGTFCVKSDTLSLNFHRYDIDSSFNTTWKQQLLRQQSETMDKLNRKYSIYIFKRVKHHLFLVSPEHQDQFSQSAFSPSGVPVLNHDGVEIFGNNFLMKVEHDTSKFK
jgi:hypothetical protein